MKVNEFLRGAATAAASAALASFGFTAPAQIRTAPRPVMQNPNAPRRDVQQPGPEQYKVLAFTVTTGDDDLRSDSSAWVDIVYPDHSKDRCELRKYSGDTWENNKSYDAPECVLGTPKTFDQLKSARMLLAYSGVGDVNTFHDQDNWNVDEVRILAENAQHTQRCLIDAAKRPYLIRMTGRQQTYDLSAAPSTC
jgi:hypothetical protein